MANQPEKPVVGQEVFVAYSQRHKRNEVLVVLKVGRVWAELGPALGQDSYVEARMSLADWSLDGGGYASPGQAFVSQEAYDAKVQREQTWFKFYQKLGHSVPANATTQAIVEAARLLGIPLE